MPRQSWHRWCEAAPSVPSQNIIQAYRKAGLLAVAKARELSIDIATDDPAARRDMLVRCAMTSMNSKLVSGHRGSVRPRPAPCTLSDDITDDRSCILAEFPHLHAQCCSRMQSLKQLSVSSPRVEAPCRAPAILRSAQCVPQAARDGIAAGSLLQHAGVGTTSSDGRMINVIGPAAVISGCR